MASSDTPLPAADGSTDAARAIGGVVRLLCALRLAVLMLAVASLASSAGFGSAIVIGLLAAPFSYVPARSWDSQGEHLSRSGILLAGDLILTVIVIFAMRGSELTFLYGAATVALLGVAVGARLALFMALPIAMVQMRSLQDTGVMIGWLGIVGLIGLVAMSWAGSQLGNSLRAQALIAHDLQHLRTQQAAVLERVRIARDLHDTVAGNLAGASLLSKGLRRRLASEGASAEVQLVAEQLDVACAAAHASTRAALGELRRAGTTSDAALRTVCDQWQQRTGVPVDADIDADLAGLPRRVTDDAQAILLELLENVRRHSGATRVAVRVAASADGATVRVSDDGRGFDSTAAPADGIAHFGLVGIAERVQVHGGELQVRSAPGAGAHIEAHLVVGLVGSA